MLNRKNKMFKPFCYLFLGIIFITPFVGLGAAIYGHDYVKGFMHPSAYHVTLDEIEILDAEFEETYGIEGVEDEYIAGWRALGVIFPTLLTGPFLEGIRDIQNIFIVWIALQTAALLLYWFFIRDKKKRRR